MATNFTSAGVLVGDDYVTVKCWISYNHAGDAVRDSYNISSVTDSATGMCTFNFSVAQPTSDSLIIASGDYSWGLGYDDQVATGSCRRVTLNNSWATQDVTYLYMSVHGS